MVISSPAERRVRRLSIWRHPGSTAERALQSAPRQWELSRRRLCQLSLSRSSQPEPLTWMATDSRPTKMKFGRLFAADTLFAHSNGWKLSIDLPVKLVGRLLGR
mgnify:CR=1 FL=1